MNGIHFFRCVWRDADGKYFESTEAGTSKRWLYDQIKYRKGGVKPSGDLVKIQPIETPIVNLDWLVKMFETGCNKKEREENREAACYVLHLVEILGARVEKDGVLTER